MAHWWVEERRVEWVKACGQWMWVGSWARFKISLSRLVSRLQETETSRVLQLIKERRPPKLRDSEKRGKN